MYTIEQGNQEMGKVINYLKETESAWNTMMNLKMYDAFFEAEDICKEFPIVLEEYNDDWYEEFHEWCDLEYNTFIEDMGFDGITDCREYIGRTSSFYLTNIHDDTMVYVLYNLLGEIASWGWFTFKTENGKIVLDEKEITEQTEEFEYIVSGEFLKDTKEFLKDAVWIADYINGFKENQVNSFRTYMELQNDMIETERKYKRYIQEQIEAATMACYI